MEKENRKAVMFTDMKDFSLKTSLLTQVQIDNLLEKQDKIILGAINRYSGKVVKTIGDSFMVVFSDPVFSILCAIEIQQLSEIYNKRKKLNLFKLEFRISLDFGLVNKKKGIKGEDYFGGVVNLSSRILERTPEKCIFISSNMHLKISDITYISSYFLGTTTFKGILNETDVYEILYKKDDIEKYALGKLKKLDISNMIIDERLTIREKQVENIIFKVSSVIAVLSIQPLPFINSAILIPLQIYLVNEIGKIYKINEKKEIIFSSIFGILGSYTLLQGIFGLSRTFFPFFGGYIIIPVNFGLTYGLGKVINQYFYYKSNNVGLSNEDMKELFKDSRVRGEKLMKKNKNKVIDVGNKYKDIILGKIDILKEKFGNIKK